MSDISVNPDADPADVEVALAVLRRPAEQGLGLGVVRVHGVGTVTPPPEETPAA